MGVNGDVRVSQNNFFAEGRPPDLLVNVIVEPLNSFPVVGEIQVHLLEVLKIKEASALCALAFTLAL